jgi:hypothetical protein
VREFGVSIPLASGTAGTPAQHQTCRNNRFESVLPDIYFHIYIVLFLLYFHQLTFSTHALNARTQRTHSTHALNARTQRT